MKQAILCGKLLNTVKKQVDTDQVILVERRPHPGGGTPGSH